jgi:hypothetical protein
MPADTRMPIDVRRTYLRVMRQRYLVAGRDERTSLLTEMEAVAGLDRKTLIRLMAGDLVRHPRQKQRARTYGSDVDDALRVISEGFDYPCAERLGGNLAWMAAQLVRHGELQATPSLMAQLAAISVPTIRRIMSRLTQDQPKLARPKPSGPNAALRDVPMRVIPWDTQEPGHFEADLVHHCGMATDRHYMHTVQLIDVATGWSERYATLGRSYARMEGAFDHILARLPFPIREIHPDNGSEFFNAYLVAYWAKETPHAQVSRSRPFHKNDNRFVEQRNSSEVRAYFGTQRLDTCAQTLAANRVYDKLWVYYNFFQPILRLVEKTAIPVEGGGFRMKLRHDAARTPFDRLCATGVLSPEKRESLEGLRDQTNPRRLKEQIYDLIDYALALPCADVCESDISSNPNQEGGKAG